MRRHLFFRTGSNLSPSRLTALPHADAPIIPRTGKHLRHEKSPRATPFSSRYISSMATQEAGPARARAAGAGHGKVTRKHAEIPPRPHAIWDRMSGDYADARARCWARSILPVISRD